MQLTKTLTLSLAIFAAFAAFVSSDANAQSLASRFATSLQQSQSDAKKAQASCQRLRRQVALLGARLARQKRQRFCGVRWAKLQTLRGQVSLLRRSMQQLCADIDRRSCAIQSAAARIDRQCVACLGASECGACPIQGAQLQRSCQKRLSVVSFHQRKLRKAQAECDVAAQTFVNFHRRASALLGR